jgi:hypothetical protein
VVSAPLSDDDGCCEGISGSSDRSVSSDGCSAAIRCDPFGQFHHAAGFMWPGDRARQPQQSRGIVHCGVTAGERLGAAVQLARPVGHQDRIARELPGELRAKCWDATGDDLRAGR